MLKPLASLFITILISVQVYSQGILLESLRIDSEILGRTVEYSIYLPESYKESQRSYPVLYLLHGYTDDETGWTQFGEVKKIADREFQSEQVTDMIIAMPDAGVSWYINSYDGKELYEDFFIKEFIPQVESAYRCRSVKQFRAVAGLSMGGHGTFIYALKHPDMFIAAAPLSAAAWTEQEVIDMPDRDWDRRSFNSLFGTNTGEKRLTSHLRSNLAHFLVRDTDPEQLKKVRYYIDCGDDDYLIKGNMQVHSMLLDKDVPHEFRVRDGGHSWEYWRSALPEVFKFVSRSFHR